MEWYQATLVIPSTPNPESALSYLDYECGKAEIRHYILNGCGGFTTWDVRGAWFNGERRVYHEQGTAYLLTWCSEDERACECIDGLREKVKAELDQQAVFLPITRLEDAPVQ